MISTKLSLPEIAPHVLFATVGWKEPESPKQRLREQLLITDWKNLTDRGAQVARLDSTIPSWSIVDSLLKSPLELGVIRQKLNITPGELSTRPTGGHIRELLSSLFYHGGVP
jgi:hypothetical protein